jgi:hypothetical protein
MQHAYGRKVSVTCPKCRSALTSPLGKVKCAICRATLVVADPTAPPKQPTDYSSLQKPVLFVCFATLGSIVVALVLAATVGGDSAKQTQRRTQAITPQVSSHVNHSGDSLRVQGNALCGSTQEALDEMFKWALRGDKSEAALVAIRTHSTAVKDGDDIKILDLGFMHTKIRIFRTGRECWVASEIARSAR